MQRVYLASGNAFGTQNEVCVYVCACLSVYNECMSLCKLARSKGKKLNWHIDQGHISQFLSTCAHTILAIVSFIYRITYLICLWQKACAVNVIQDKTKDNNPTGNINSLAQCCFYWNHNFITVPVCEDLVCQSLRAPSPHSHHLHTPGSGSCQTSETGADWQKYTHAYSIHYSVGLYYNYSK